MTAPTVLAFADRAAARDRIAQVVATMGGRLIALPIEGAAERLEQQVSLDAVVIDIAEDTGGAIDALFDAVESGVAARRFVAVVCVAPALIDMAAAGIGGGDVALLVDAGPIEQAAAIGAALAEQRLGLNDISSDAVMPRLQQLSEEVGRIARTLATLAQVEASRPSSAPLRDSEPEAEGTAPGGDAQQVRAIIRARRLRESYFEAELFADPAWDMLLDLTAARLERRRVAVSSLCIAAAVPPTTALRWIKTLTDHGVLVRIADPSDGRRVFIELSQNASDAMLRYLSAVPKAALPI